MKKSLPLFIAIAALMMMAGCANIYKMNKAELKVVPVSSVLTDTAKWEAIGKDIQAGKEAIFLINKGQSIPVKFNFSSPIAKLNPGKNTLMFTQDTYLLVSSTKMRISTDGESWADIHDFQALKSLLGYKNGTLSVGLGANKEEGTQISIDISAK